METVEVRFYFVEKDKDSTPSLTQALKQIDKISPPGDRTKTLKDGTKLRLERLEEEGDLLKGEITKIELPSRYSEVHPDKLESLSLSGDLGTEVAFVYDKKRSLLALHHNRTVCGPSRFSTYLRKVNDSYRYSLSVEVNEDAWAEFEKGEVTRFQVRIKIPKDLSELNNNEITKSISQMAKLYDSPFFTMQMSVGHQKSSLSDSIKAAARSLFSSPVEVKSMKAKVVSDPDEIDLSNNIYKEIMQIDMTGCGPDERYIKRVNYVKSCLNSFS